MRGQVHLTPDCKSASVAFITSLVLVTLLAGCSVATSPEDHVVEAVKDKYSDAPWMANVTDWSRGGIADFSPDTDLPADEVESYALAVDICNAIMSEVADGADDPLVRVFGIKTSNGIDVDGSRHSENRSEMLAQFSSTFNDECGATPPYELEKKVKAAEVPLY